MQEFLVIVAIALAIFYLPRLMGKKPEAEPAIIRWPALKGRMRLAILVTFFWVAGLAAYLKPWENDILLFLSAGLGPAAVLWGVAWVWSGYKKYRS